MEVGFRAAKKKKVMPIADSIRIVNFDQTYKALKADIDAREKFVEDAREKAANAVYESVVEKDTVGEILHWFQAIGGEVALTSIARLVRERSRAAISSSEILKDLAAFIPAHVIAETVGRVYFPHSDWPSTLLSPLLAGYGSYLLKGDLFQAIFAGLGPLLTARWNPEAVDIKALRKSWEDQFITSANPEFSDFIEDPAAFNPQEKQQAFLLQKLATSSLGTTFLSYNEYIHMPKMSFKYASAVDEKWTLQSPEHNPGGAEMFFSSVKALDGYAKQHGYVAWQAQMASGPANRSDIPFDHVYFFSKPSWNAMWVEANKTENSGGNPISPTDFFWVEGGDGGRSGVGNVVGMHPTLYNDVFHEGRRTITDVMQNV